MKIVDMKKLEYNYFQNYEFLKLYKCYRVVN